MGVSSSLSGSKKSSKGSSIWLGVDVTWCVWWHRGIKLGGVCVSWGFCKALTTGNIWWQSSVYWWGSQFSSPMSSMRSSGNVTYSSIVGLDTLKVNNAARRTKSMEVLGNVSDCVPFSFGAFQCSFETSSTIMPRWRIWKVESNVCFDEWL